jgi:V/A-type H+-transporting ATPase subunit I
VVTAERLAALLEEKGRLDAAVTTLSTTHDVAGALGDFALIDWLGRHAGNIAGSERLAWITGWTSDETGETLRAALARREVRHLLRLLPEPPGANAPLVLRNPPWARAFEVYAGMMGTPGRNEADPSLLLAVVAPLMFGFMFGDVGQGAVLIASGLIFGGRMPVLRLLVPGGVAAMGFGLLFGSVFCREDLIPALWLQPLSEPLTLLAVALAGGVVLLLIGLVLDAVQSLWREDGRSWAYRQAGFVVTYLALLVAIAWRPALWAALVGALWYVAGAVLLSHRDRRVEAGIALAEFVEQTAQLLVNTVSFARVGAFALAHAGLSAAIVGVAEVFGGVGFWVTLVLGNLLVLALEGLVVGIQTTRLVLFEFFIRFLRGGGRKFAPLEPPRIDWAVVAEKL